MVDCAGGGISGAGPLAGAEHIMRPKKQSRLSRMTGDGNSIKMVDIAV